MGRQEPATKVRGRLWLGGKTHLGRQTLITDAARAWLVECWPANPGSLAPFETLERNEEWYQVELVRLREAAGLTKWPHNVLRHLFASYHYARHTDYRGLAQQMGNLESQARKYVVLLDDPGDAERYWRITPDYLRTKFGGASQAVSPTPPASEVGQV